MSSRGMELFREKYKRVVFVYVSDDMDWGRKHLGGPKDLHFAGAGEHLDDDSEEVWVQEVIVLILLNIYHNIILSEIYL